MFSGFKTAIASEAADTNDQDRVTAMPCGASTIVAVADGAGGSGDGGWAADAVIDAVRSAAARSDAQITDGLFWQDLLAQVDRELAAEGSGETTAVVAVVTDELVTGASVGDSQAWLIDDAGFTVLTERQIRKPLVGDGRAIPMPFECPHERRTLVVGSDGLFNYVQMDRLLAIVRGNEVNAIPAGLIDAARLRSGALQDDIAVGIGRWS